MRKAILGVTGSGLGALLLAATAPGAPIAFARIKPGAWQLRALDGGGENRRICLANPADLIQLRHPGAACERFVVTDDADTAAVHYRCAGAGYGRTTIKVETPELIRIESQGLVNQAPFELRLEARRAGACGAEPAGR